MQTHICRLCDEEKDINEFYLNNTHRKNPTIDACKKCKQSQLQERYSKSDESWLKRNLAIVNAVIVMEIFRLQSIYNI